MQLAQFVTPREHGGQFSGDVVVSNPYPVEQVRQIPAELQELQSVTIWPQSRHRLSLRRFAPMQVRQVELLLQVEQFVIKLLHARH